MPSLLLVLPQFPFDSASGAARSMREICEVLARSGWKVRAVAPTATEASEQIDARGFLEAAGRVVSQRPPRRDRYKNDRRVLLVDDRKLIAYTLLDTGGRRPLDWEIHHGSQFDRLFDDELKEHRPDVVFGYGGFESHLLRFARAKKAGCKLVFGLRNGSYFGAGWLSRFDGILTPSEHMAKRYQENLGIDVVGIPSALVLEDVVADQREPIFFTVINPSVEKGAFFVARLAEELGLRRPDIPLLVIESRGSGQLLLEAGLSGGFDLRRHENLMFAPAVAQPKDIYRATRALLVPSVWEEAGPRVVPEALLNGIPSIVSDRGNLPNFASDQGLMLPLPATLSVNTRIPVEKEAVQPWIAAIERWADDEGLYLKDSARALAASAAYHPDRITARYLDFFARFAPSPRSEA